MRSAVLRGRPAGGHVRAAARRVGRARPCQAGALARIVAVLALYALALQGVLGSLALAATGPEHVLCLADDSPDGPAATGKSRPAQGHMACCTVCQAAGPAALPEPAPALAEPAAYPAAPAGPRPRRESLPRAPPRRAFGARAPPVV